MSDLLQVFALAFSLEAGYLDDYTRADGVNFIQYDTYYSETNLRVEAMDMFFVGWGTKVTFKDTPSLFYLPVTNEYTIEAGVKLFGFEAGISHLCAHPATSVVGGKITIPDPLHTAFNRVYLIFEGKLGGSK